MSTARVDTIFEWCRDIVAVRAFYTGALGLEDENFDEERGWVTYQLGETQLVFLQSEDAPASQLDWAENFHLHGAKVQSWVIRIPPADFGPVRARIEAAGYETTPPPDASQPMLFVRDPSGRTIELWAPENEGEDEP